MPPYTPNNKIKKKTKKKKNKKKKTLFDSETSPTRQSPSSPSYI